MKNSDLPMIKIGAIQGSIFIDVNSLLSLYDFFKNQWIHMSEEQKLENHISFENLEGRIAALDFIKGQIKEQANSFAVELELDLLGLGKGSTKTFKMGEEPPKII